MKMGKQTGSLVMGSIADFARSNVFCITRTPRPRDTGTGHILVHGHLSIYIIYLGADNFSRKRKIVCTHNALNTIKAAVNTPHNDQRFSHFHGAGLCAHTDDPCEEGYLRGAPSPVPLTFPDTRVLFFEEQDIRWPFFHGGPEKNLSSEKKSEERRMADSDDIHLMEPREWGRHAWAFLHTSTFSYPEKPSAIQKESARQVFKNIGNILPCPVCRGHYNDNIKKNSPESG